MKQTIDDRPGRRLRRRLSPLIGRFRVALALAARRSASRCGYEWLATDTITAVARVAGFRRPVVRARQPLPQHGRRPARDPSRARARRSLSRHLRRLPARGDRVRAQRAGLGRRRARRERAGRRARGDLAARVLAGRGERPSAVARRLPHRERLRQRPRRSRSTTAASGSIASSRPRWSAGRCGPARPMTPATCGRSSSTVTRSSSRCCASRSARPCAGGCRRWSARSSRPAPERRGEGRAGGRVEAAIRVRAPALSRPSHASARFASRIRSPYVGVRQSHSRGPSRRKRSSHSRLATT